MIAPRETAWSRSNRVEDQEQALQLERPETWEYWYILRNGHSGLWQMRNVAVDHG